MEIFSSFLSLCCPGSCCIAGAKQVSCLISRFSQNTCFPVSCPVECSAALTVVGPSCQPWEMSLCLQGVQEQCQRLHSGDRLCAQDKLSQAMCGSSEASGVFLVSLIFATSSLLWQHQKHQPGFPKSFCICLSPFLLLLTGFKSHQLVGRHPNEVTSCKTPEYP